MRSSVLKESPLESRPQAVEETLVPIPPLAQLRGIRFWIIPSLMLVVVLVVLVGLATTADASTRAGISALSQSVAMLLAASAALVLLWRAPRGRARWSWGCIALSFGFYLLADIIDIVLSFTLPATQATYLSGAAFLPFYPLLAIGVLLLPSSPRTGVQQVRVVLDVCIGVGALFGLDLVFLIAPRLATGSVLELVYIAYPVADFGLLLVAVLLVVRGVQRAYRPAFFWLLVGMVCFIYADSTFNYLTLPSLDKGSSTGVSFGVPVVDPFWLAGIFAFCLASLSLLVRGNDPGAGWDWLDRLASFEKLSQRARLWAQFALLTVPIIVLFFLLVYIENQTGRDRLALLPLTGLLLGLVLLIILRLWLTMRDLVDARIATERARQLDALKDQFITSVNHELRTPLMTMQGYLELLGDQEARVTPEKRWDMLERARGACGNLVHLVRSILDTRRIEQEADNFTPEIVSVREAAQAALSLMDPREANPAGRHLRLHIPEDLTIWGDPVRVQQILTNLLSNAIKYSPPEAPITVIARPVTEKSAHLLGWGATSRAARQMVEIVVQDKGLGIPPDQKDLLFRRFVRLPREIASNIHGNGLGLYLCRVFAEAMGGTIWVESSGIPGEGSSFYLRLPVPEEQRLQTPPPALAARTRE
jgi:signal transduction histidine kinase